MEDSLWVWIMGGVSLAIIIAAMVIVPQAVLRLPADFSVRQRSSDSSWKRSPGRIALRIGKNIAGIALITAGIAMLLLPGQGILAMLIGVFLLDVPGKHRLQLWLVSQPPVMKPINWYREKKGRPPMQNPADDRPDAAAQSV